MSIYEKLSKVQLALMKRDIKKTGFNKFKKYHYHTLDDLMPHCLEECHKEGLTFFFNFRNNEAIIRLHDWEAPTDSITCGLPFPELVLPDDDAKNKNNIIVQDMGAAVTHLKRYLLINLFDISEGELIDSDLNDASSAEKQEENVVEDVITTLDLEALYTNALKKLESKGLSGDEITHSAIRKQIFKDNKFTVKSERNEIAKYCKETWGASK